jgi:hypothetical protein
MSDLVVFENVSDRKPDAPARRRQEEFASAWKTLEDSLKAAGFTIEAYRAAFLAACRLTDPWYARTLRLERQLRSALACDGLTDDLRAGILRALYGKRGMSRAMISDAETKLLEDYRALDAAERQMVRTLLDRLVRLHALSEDPV